MGGLTDPPQSLNKIQNINLLNKIHMHQIQSSQYLSSR
ncbi:hypothetical protein K661_02963 [Piscirickettsia salmonis LF-89 = ATCC VR-1361]|nr:hypothetical protein K661_02963 [Piscirickettsia salmonis LF-89 = ATCC VR-1361]